MRGMSMGIAADAAMLMRSMIIAMNMETAAGVAMDMRITLMVTSMETTASAAMITVIAMKSMITNMETDADAAMIMVIAMKDMETVVDVVTTTDMTMETMSTHIATMYRAIPRTVTVSCATLMRSTAMCAVRAWINVPAKCLTKIW